MPRQVATGRVLAKGRKPVDGRKPIGFIDDGKIHAVLDTNIVIYAIEALFKKSLASQIEQDSLQIIREIDKGTVVIAINAKLYSEYRRVAERILSENRANSSDVNYVLNLVCQVPNLIHT